MSLWGLRDWPAQQEVPHHPGGHSSWREQLELDSLARRSDRQSAERAGTGETGEKGDR